MVECKDTLGRTISALYLYKVIKVTECKTMFARYQDILAGQVDEDGMGINNVGKALERVGINIRDAEGGFRDFSDVLDDLYPKWQSLNEVEQANILKAMAGVRQRESLLVLLENETKYRKALTETMNAEGLAADRYAIYLKSVEAAQNRLTASWEKLVMSSATGDMIADFYDGASAALDFIDALGGIPTILKIAIPVLILFNAELIKTKLLSGAGIVQGLISGFTTLIPVLTGTTVAAQGTTASFMAANVAALPFVLTIGAITAGLIYGIKVIHDYKVAQDEILNAHKDASQEILETAKNYEDYIAVTKKGAEAAGYLYDENGRMYKEAYHGNKVYVEGMQLLTETQWNAKFASSALTEQLQGEKDVLEETAEVVSEVVAEYVGFSETLNSLVDTLDTMDGLIEKSMSGELDFSDVTKIPDEYLDALTVEGDKLKLNIDIIKQKQLAEAEMSLNSIRLAQERGEATAQEVSVIQLYYDQLLAQSQNTFGQFNQTAWQYDALLWQIANDAQVSGAYITDAEGKALTSAQSIFEYMSQGNAQFNNVVQQIANLTGKSVEQVMAQINGMIQTTVNNAAALINYLGSASLGVDSGFNRAPTPPTLSSSGSLFEGMSGGGGGGSGGGGRSNEESEELARQREELERIRELERQIADARRDAVDVLKDQLSGYKKIIDARKKLLDTMEDERQYQKAVEEKNRDILSVQNELSALQFDDSEEAQARRRVLEEQLRQLQSELEDIQTEESIEDQKDALDKEYERMERRINRAIKAIESINANSIEGFAAALAQILQRFHLPEMHTGGIVGKGTSQASSGTSVKSNEILVKMLKGEVVATEAQADNFVKNTLPQIAQSSSVMNGGDMQISIPIQVMGNLDKNALPGLEKLVKAAVEQLNKNMLDRGYTRRAESFGN